MAKVELIPLIVLGCIFALAFSAAEVSKTSQTSKEGKVFSLFSIVTFKNRGCSSNSGTTGTTSRNRNGTCYTSTECANKGGSASGNCAAGFGVCCLFVVTAATSAINQNCTYIQNPGFPSAYTATTGLTYTVQKCSADVCSLRLDFETFTLDGMSAFDDSGDCKDSFAVTASPSTFTYPVICGKNSGYHVYVDVGTAATSSANLAFTFGTASFNRNWEIKVTQVLCYQNSRPYSPNCFQYHTGIVGRIETFNFQEPTPALQQHLNSQNYNICIRQESGYCCIQYYPCADTNSFNIDSPAMAKVGTDCVNDYIGIDGGSAQCTTSPGNVLFSRFCGQIFAAVGASPVTAPVCDCSAPFNVNVFLNIKSAATTPPNQRGVCLEYQQLPCNA